MLRSHPTSAAARPSRPPGSTARSSTSSTSTSRRATASTSRSCRAGTRSDYDLPTIVQALGRFYFLPAVQTSDLKDATVVVSYFEDPALLHRKFITQVRAGLQPLWVSRIRSP